MLHAIPISKQKSDSIVLTNLNSSCASFTSILPLKHQHSFYSSNHTCNYDVSNKKIIRNNDHASATTKPCALCTTTTSSDCEMESEGPTAEEATLQEQIRQAHERMSKVLLVQRRRNALAHIFSFSQQDEVEQQ